MKSSYPVWHIAQPTLRPYGAAFISARRQIISALADFTYGDLFTTGDIDDGALLPDDSAALKFINAAPMMRR